MVRKILIIFLFFIKFCLPQGPISLFQASDFVCIIKTKKTKTKYIPARILNTFKGFKINEIYLINNKYTSDHIKPKETTTALIFAVRLKGRCFGILQKDMAYTDEHCLYFREWKELVRNIITAKDKTSKLNILCRGLNSPFKEISTACAQDILVFPQLKQYIDESAKHKIFSLFQRLSPDDKRTEILVHVLGILKPTYWDKYIIDKLEKSQNILFGISAGKVLSKYLGMNYGKVLIEKINKNYTKALLAAVTAFREDYSIRYISSILNNKEWFKDVLSVLSFCPTYYKAKIFEKALDILPPEKTDTAKMILMNLKRTKSIFSRNLLKDISSGKKFKKFTFIALEVLKKQ